jgi:hypothetical protein
MKPPSKSPKNVKDYAPKLPPGAHVVPNSATVRALKGAPHPGVVTIDKNFVSNPRGGGELVVGKKELHVKDRRTHSPR